MDSKRNETAARVKTALKVAVACNIKKNETAGQFDSAAEFDDYGTVCAIMKALRTGNREVSLIEAEKEFPLKIAETEPDIVFNIAEGMNGAGREARVPAILNHLGIPFTGSDEVTMCLALDKALTKRLLSTYRIATPNYKTTGENTRFSAAGLSWPVIVKPNCEGSSMGITDRSIARDEDELFEILNRNAGQYNRETLVEEYIPGREFTVGILGNGKETRVFPPMEIIFKDAGNGVYGFDVKKDFKKYIEYKCPPLLDKSKIAEIEKTALKIFSVMRCRDCARVDFRLSPEGKLYFIEINPLPGLAPGYSDFPMIAEFCGMDYDALIRNILNCALKRYNITN